MNLTFVAISRNTRTDLQSRAISLPLIYLCAYGVPCCAFPVFATHGASS